LIPQFFHLFAIPALALAIEKVDSLSFQQARGVVNNRGSGKTAAPHTAMR
jgi:hypothetical protein